MSRNTPSPQASVAANVATALAALQGQIPLGPLLMPNHMGLGNLAGLSPQDLSVLSQAFQQMQQASLQQQINSYVEMLQHTALGAQKSQNVNNVQAAAQLFQVIFFAIFFFKKLFDSQILRLYLNSINH